MNLNPSWKRQNPSHQNQVIPPKNHKNCKKKNRAKWEVQWDSCSNLTHHDALLISSWKRKKPNQVEKKKKQDWLTSSPFPPTAATFWIPTVMVHSNNNIIMIVLIPEVPILDQMHLQLNPACNFEIQNEKKKRIGTASLEDHTLFLLASVFQRILFCLLILLRVS